MFKKAIPLIILALVSLSCLSSEKIVSNITEKVIDEVEGQINQVLPDEFLTQLPNLTTSLPYDYLTQLPDLMTQAPNLMLTQIPMLLTPQPGQGAGTGMVFGQICYPSEFIPPMLAFFENINTGEVSELPIALNQSNYSIELESGTYQAYAWLYDFNYGGTYSEAVECGLSVNCTDHTLRSFSVQANTSLNNINICDWYGDPANIPIPGDLDLNSYLGSISGTLSYPSEYIPALMVVARNTFTNSYQYVITVENQNTYQINNLGPGNYTVVAYVLDSSLAGGYSQAVPCGLSANCTDHSLIPVTVYAGQVSSGVNPQDWYAPPGSFPAKPTP